MKKIIRVLNIRKHKNVTFIDAYESLGKKLQFICSNEILKTYSIKIGDLICFFGFKTNTKKGLEIIKINSILWHNSCLIWISPKGVHNKIPACISQIHFNARNGGNQIELWKFKRNLINKIRNHLICSNFLDIKCRCLENKLASTLRKPFTVVSSKQKRPIYLRITMENQLKQACAILLNSVFSIDYVFYDKSISKNIDKETYILEFVSLEYTNNDIISFIKKVDHLTREIYANTNLKDFSLPHRLEIISYSELLKKGINYDSNIPQLDNTIVINVPTYSPFIKMNNNNERCEIQWFLRGKMIGHGYEDETDYTRLLEVVNDQKKSLNMNICNEMNYMNYGLPNTTSFGIGIDQLIYRFLDLNHILNISNPLGFYFD